MSEWSLGDVLEDPRNRPLHRPYEKSSTTYFANIKITLNKFLHNVVYICLGTVTLILNEL